MPPRSKAQPEGFHSRKISILLHAGFVLAGVVTTLLGPVLPYLSARWALDDAQAGAFFTAQFAGAIAGTAASSLLFPRLGYLRSSSIGFVLMSAGVGGLASSVWAGAIVSVIGYGFGLGITIPATNLLVARMNPNARDASLNILNFAWGLGAVASPPVISLFARSGHLGISHMLLVSLLAFVAACLLKTEEQPIAPGEERSERTNPRIRVWRSSFGYLLGAMMFLYVGTENALGGWVTSYALRNSGATNSGWAFAQSAFWAALLAGRGLSPAILRYLSGPRLALAGLIMTLAGVASILGATHFAGLLTGVVLAGAGLASVFPSIIALFSQYFGNAATRGAGLFFALGGLGGAVLPWFVGFFSAQRGNLAAGLFIPLAGSAVMVLLQISILAFIRANHAAFELET